MSTDESLIEHGEITESVLELANRAEDCLIHSNNLLKSKVKREKEPEPISIWALFLENQPSTNTIETCAVSIGGATLLITGEENKSDIIEEAARLVAKLQREDGGWTSFFPSKEEESLLIEAYFALLFLMRTDRSKYQNVIRRGIEWIIHVENPETGGWGFFAGDNSHILTTSYAVRVIAEWGTYQDESLIIRDIINRGLTWMANCQKVDGSWPGDHNPQSSAVQTAIALLALIPSGLFRKYSKPVIEGRKWLIEHIDDRNGVDNNYVVPKRDNKGNIIGHYRRISHVNFPEGIILQALLACGVDITDRRIIRLIKDLIDAQTRDGSWKSFLIAYEKPIFAMLDACIALSQFTINVKNNEKTLGIKEDLLTLHRQIIKLQSEQDITHQLVDETRTLLRQVNEKLINNDTNFKNNNYIVEEIQKFNRGLFWLRPIANIGNLVIKYPLVILAILALILYLAFKLFFNINNSIIDIVIAVISTLLLLIKLIEYYKSKNEKKI